MVTMAIKLPLFYNIVMLCMCARVCVCVHKSETMAVVVLRTGNKNGFPQAESAVVTKFQ